MVTIKKIILYQESDRKVITVISHVYSIDTRERSDGLPPDTLVNGSLFDVNVPYVIVEDAELPDIQEGDIVDISLLMQKRKDEKIKELDNRCNQAILEGFTSTTTGHVYRFNYEDQLNFTQQMVLLVSDPSIQEIDWKTEDVGIVSHSRDQFLFVCGEMGTHKRSQIEKYWDLKNQVMTATSLDEVDQIHW